MEGLKVSQLYDLVAMPVLTTERLTLREVHPEDDLPALYELFADAQVARFTDTGPFTAMAEAAEVMAWIKQIFAEQSGMRWAITFNSDQETLIGTCGYHQWNRSNNCAEFGYDLKQQFWGTGLMTEALRAMIGFGFEQLYLNRIEADVTVGNDGSARVLEKLGFSEEGLLRQRGYWKGDYHDLRFFGLLRHDWQT
jgi:RimJ/RimL family protein N-acetyltransferase